MYQLLLAAAAEAPRSFFYEKWIIVKQLIWLFGEFMSLIMKFLDQVGIHNIALCIVIFTVVSKMVLLPLTIKQQKTTKLNAYIQPELQAIQKKYRGRTDSISQQKMMEEQRMVQEKYGISMAAGCLPMLIQMPILFALYPVIYNMDKYVSYLAVLKDKLSAEEFAQMYNLLGINLQEAPGWRLTWAFLIPILCAATQFISTQLMMAAQGQNNDDNPMNSTMKSMNLFMPLMMGVFAVSFPAFLGWYWVIQSLVMMLQQIVINKHLSKISVEEMIQQNIEKANKKRAVKGQPPIGAQANMNTRNLESSRSAQNNTEKEEQLRKAREYYASRSANPGSLSAKANMVRDYNEKNKK